MLKAVPVGMLISFGLVILVSPPLQASINTGYPDDSFWTLGWGGRAGVLAITMIGFVLLYALLALKSRALQDRRAGIVVLDIAAGLLIYAVVYSLSPQVFYWFYRMILPDLPSQVVIKSPLDLTAIRAAIDFGDGPSLAQDIAGVGLWAVVPFSLWARWIR
jgi:hypothetical protein